MEYLYIFISYFYYPSNSQLQLTDVDQLMDGWEFIMNDDRVLNTPSSSKYQEILVKCASRPLISMFEYKMNFRKQLNVNNCIEESLAKLNLSCLDNSIKVGIINNFIKKNGPEWSTRLNTIFEDSIPFWDEPYLLRLSGMLKNAAFLCLKSELPNSLTIGMLVDLKWLMFKTILDYIRHNCGLTLTVDQIEEIAKLLSTVEKDFIQLWSSAIVNSAIGMRNSGKLPSKWACEDRARVDGMREKRGNADAKYSFTPYRASIIGTNPNDASIRAVLNAMLLNHRETNGQTNLHR